MTFWDVSFVKLKRDAFRLARKLCRESGYIVHRFHPVQDGQKFFAADRDDESAFISVWFPYEDREERDCLENDIIIVRFGGRIVGLNGSIAREIVEKAKSALPRVAVDGLVGQVMLRGKT